jgi:hypothetical protein
MSDDEDDLAAILDLPLAKSKRGDIMDDDSEVANTMTEIDMTGDLIVMHEDVTAVNMQELHTGMNEEGIFAKKELPADDTHLYNGKHITNQVARCDDRHMDVDSKYVTTFKRPEEYEAACKIDVSIKTNLKEVKNETDRRGTEMLADNTYLQAMNETYKEEDIDMTPPEINIENISIMKAGTNKPPGTAAFDVKGLHTREKKEDLFTKEEPPADNKVLAKHEYEGKPAVQNAPNVSPQEELPADTEDLTKYGYSHGDDKPDGNRGHRQGARLHGRGLQGEGRCAHDYHPL